MNIKKYSTRFIFYTTKKLKKEMKKRAQELDIPMSDYVRTLVKQDLMINQIYNINIIKEQNMICLDNFNKKLSGHLKGLR